MYKCAIVGETLRGKSKTHTCTKSKRAPSGAMHESMRALQARLTRDKSHKRTPGANQKGSQATANQQICQLRTPGAQRTRQSNAYSRRLKRQSRKITCAIIHRTIQSVESHAVKEDKGKFRRKQPKHTRNTTYISQQNQKVVIEGWMVGEAK